MRQIFLYMLLFVLLPLEGIANVTLPSIFSDHMVLQCDSEIRIWGWGKTSEEVKISASWDTTKIYEVKIGTKGKWSIDVNTPDPGGPYSMIIQGYNRIQINDILIGEIWLCSGQSNMEWTPSMGIDDAEKHIELAKNEQIRFFSVNHKTSEYPQDDLNGEWVKCSPATMRNFSAIGYFFANELTSSLDCPVGMILSAWGGTPAEIWMSKEIFEDDPVLKSAAEKLIQEPWGPKDPGMAYNAMVYPLVPFRIAGALWYQGESNISNSTTYSRLLSALIKNWRDDWGYEFPFYYAQIAPFKYGEKHMNGGIIRDQQRRVLELLKNTGMVVTADIGDINDIHPRNKEDVGKRLAAIALNKTYNKINTVFSGPIYKSHSVRGPKVIVEFDNAEGGLKAKGDLDQFELAGLDGNYYPAIASIDGSTIVLLSPNVDTPTNIRYAMKNTASHNLYNISGLPASCFTTDFLMTKKE